MHAIEAALLKSTKQQSANSGPLSLIIAYSGGLDSSALLYAAVQLFEDGYLKGLSAAHVNHGLQQEAAAWQAHCLKQCQTYNISMMSKQFELAALNKTSEEDARIARYEYFASLVADGKTIAFAHHLDDQVETILFRLFRGTGIHGMSGMPQSRSLANGQLIRPLLDFSRKQLLEYAELNNLNWIEDPSNQTNHYSRNFIRNDVIPLLRAKWHSVSKSIAQFSVIAKDQIEILDEVAEQDLLAIEVNGSSLSILELAKLSLARQKNILHYWTRAKSSRSPTAAEIDEVLTQLNLSQTSDINQQKSIEIKVSNGWVRSFSQQLYFCQNEEPKALNSSVVWESFDRALDLTNELSIHSIKANHMPSTADKNLLLRTPRNDEIVTVRPRIGGEVVKPSYREHSTELKKIYQELKIPTWKRKWLPVIYYNEMPVAVPGIFVEKSLQDLQNGVLLALDLNL